jgi:integrase
MFPRADDLRDIVVHDGAIRRIQTLFTNAATLHTTLIAFLSVVRLEGGADKQVLQRVWYPALSEVAKKLREQRASHTMTPRQKQVHVTWEQVTDAFQNLSKTRYGKRDHLLLAMYYLLPPRRQMDYTNVKLVTEAQDDTQSHINMGAAKPYIRVVKFKTAKFMDPWQKPLPTALLRILRASLRSEPRRYLFTQSDGSPYNCVNSFTKHTNRTLKNIFHKAVTINTLRHAFATHIHKTNVSKQPQVAFDMGHSIDMHKAYVLLKGGGSIHTPGSNYQ